MPADLTNPVFTDETKAREWLEASRWPSGPVCPHCGATSEHATRLEGRASRPGLWQCNACHGQFSVTVGTLYERSHIPLHKWLLATHLMTSSKKGISAHQVHRMLGITYKSAWFMCHRIREAMTDYSPAPMGSGGGTVEADEAFIGNSGKPKPGKQRSAQNKNKVFTMIERGGKARSFRVPDVNSGTLVPLMKANIDKSAKVMTDSAWAYGSLPFHFAQHEAVNHSKKEFVRGTAHINSTEAFWSIFKRGVNGTYHHISQQHLNRYLAEFDFRYSNRTALGVEDAERAAKALKGITGKRLTYRQTIRKD